MREFNQHGSSGSINRPWD